MAVYIGSTKVSVKGGKIDSPLLSPWIFDYIPNYVMGDEYIGQDSTNNRTDIYKVYEGVSYLLRLGTDVGNRFRAVVITTDPTTATDGQHIKGMMVVNKTNPGQNESMPFTADRTGYLAVTKDNVAKEGVITYLYRI